jgi:hypothetical protein
LEHDADLEHEGRHEEVADENGGTIDHAHKSFPTWLETVDVMINANIANRDSRGGHGGRGGRGRGGRGRGGR